MDNRVIGLFDDRNEAQRAQQELVQAGISDRNINLVAQSIGGQGTEEIQAGTTEQGGFWASIRRLFGSDIPEEEAGYYSEGTRRGGTVLAVDTPEDRVPTVIDILQRHHPVDIEQRAEEWKQAGWQGFQTSAKPKAAPPKAGEQSIPIVEEQLHVGKQRVREGGVRVYSRIVEKPVEQDVQLREEHVKVERRPVDRPAGEAAFSEKSIEATEMREEPVVSKEARVVEEVSLRKEAEQRTETVRGTVRRTEVEVEPTQGTGQPIDESFFRSNFDTLYANRGMTFEEYRPAYLYGHRLASEQQYSGKDWDVIESDIQQRYEKEQPGKWQQFKDSIRYAFDRARQSTKRA